MYGKASTNSLKAAWILLFEFVVVDSVLFSANLLHRFNKIVKLRRNIKNTEVLDRLIIAAAATFFLPYQCVCCTPICFSAVDSCYFWTFVVFFLFFARCKVFRLDGKFHKKFVTNKNKVATCVHLHELAFTREPRQCDLCSVRKIDRENVMWHMFAIFTDFRVLVLFTFPVHCVPTTRTSRRAVKEEKRLLFIFKRLRW